MHCKEVRLSEALDEAPVLIAELKEFERRISETGRSTYAAHEGKHDDLVSALMLALWRACDGLCSGAEFKLAVDTALSSVYETGDCGLFDHTAEQFVEDA